MFGNERHRDRAQRFGAFIPQRPDRVVRVRFQPLHRADPRLVRQNVLVPFAAYFFQLVRDKFHALFHFIFVRIAAFGNVGGWHTVRGEENDRFVRRVFKRLRFQRVFYQLCHARNVSRATVPRRNDRVL